MPVRTDAAAVQAVLNRNYDFKRTPSLAPFIEAASSVVDDAAALASQRYLTLTDAKLELIERWLSAHFYLMNDRILASKSEGGASGSYAGSVSDGLESTQYGQMAVRLDSSGSLRILDKRQTAGTLWLGKLPSEQIPVDGRD